MSVQQKVVFLNGINSDVSDELVPSQQSRYRMNVRVMSSNNSTIGAAETVNGNDLVAYTLPTGGNVCIGWCEDLLRKKAYAMIYNSSGSHSILEYDEAANTITLVLQDITNQYLNFHLDHLITGINVVNLDTNNNLLYWTDNYVDPDDKNSYNEPKKINIEKGKLFSSGDFVNGYSSPFNPENIFRIKQPPLFEPTAEYGDDPLQLINYLEQKLFQFKADYIYDDKEETATSPISKTIYPKCNCGLSEDSVLNNFIDVTVDTGIDIVKRIKIFAKEVNATDFVEIVDLDKELYAITSNSTYTYRFFNDGNYLPLEINKSIKLYDRVPKRSQSQELIEGTRVVDGLITEEFDPVAIDMKLNLSLAADIVAPTFNIAGYVQIINYCLSVDTRFNEYQPIFVDTTANGNLAFGGIHAFQGLAPCEGHTNNVDSPSGYNQLIPLAGFTFYLAGTSHLGTSIQITAIHANQNPNGSYQIDNTGDRNDVRDEMKALNAYSRWVIPDVPAGTYILRVASHLTTQDTIDNGSYQNTSTYTVGVCDYDMNEAVITIGTDGNVTIGSDTYFYDEPTNTTTIGRDRTTYIADTSSGNANLPEALCAAPSVTSPSYCANAGYLVDVDSKGIELGKLTFDHTDPVNIPIMRLTSQVGSSFVTTKKNNIGDEIAYTDHNGFYWHLCLVIVKVCGGNIDVTKVELGTTDITSTVPISNRGICYRLNLFTSVYSSPDDDLRTKLTGSIFYQGNPISGVIAITTRGHYGITDSQGNFSITIYQDSGSVARQGTLYYYLEGNCIAFFGDENFDNYSFNIGSGGGANYNYTYIPAPYSINIANILGNQPINALKRGGVYPFGIVYYDHGNRSGLTNVNDWSFDEIPPEQNKYGTSLFIPFYTETTEIGSAELSYTMIVDGANILYGGQHYTAPTIAFSGGGATTDATATLSLGAGLILSFSAIVNDTGLVNGVYLNEPLTGGTGTGGTADITIVGGTIESIVVNAPGTGYITGDVLASAVTGSAAFTVNSDAGTITGIIITLPGSGYTSIPTLTITDATGSDAVISPTFEVEDPLIITTGGFGYSVTPGITFFGGSPLTIATATATIVNGVVVSTELTDPGSGYESFPTLLITGKVWGGSYPILGWEIFNEPPPNWATHYQIIRGKDSSTDYYIDFVVDEITYDVPNSQMHITVKNIYTTFKTLFPDSILTYDFVASQRIRFIKDANGDFYQNYYDFKIKSFDSGTGVITTEINNLMPTIAIGALFEIYFPKLNVPENQQIVFEIGETHDIIESANGFLVHGGGTKSQILGEWDSSADNGGFLELTSIDSLFADSDIGRSIRVTSGSYDTYGTITSVTSATVVVTDITFTIADDTGLLSVAAYGDFIAGDTFYRFRTMPYDSVTTSTKLRLIEDSNFSDFFHSKGWDLGRPNLIDPEIAEITRPSTIYYSEKLIPETNINGLSSVFDTNFETYEAKYGGIYKLHNENLRLQVFQELKIGAVLVNQIIYNDLQNQNTVGASENVLSPQIVYYVGEYGIGKEPESFAIYANAKYGIDVRRGTPWRLSNDGLTPISDTAFMHNYFNDKCRDILDYPGKVNIYGTFDIRFNEYVIAFSNFSLTEVSNAETLAFNEKANAWSTFYSYDPEFMGMNGIDIVSFKEGALYTHNTNSSQNTFYGVSTPSEIWALCNLDPSKVKVLEAVSVETEAGETASDIWKVSSITTPNGQETKMIYDTNWVKRENNYYAFVKRDLNTVNVVNPVVNGNVMRDRTFLLKFKYSSLEYNKVFALNFYVIGSERSNK